MQFTLNVKPALIFDLKLTEPVITLGTDPKRSHDQGQIENKGKKKRKMSMGDCKSKQYNDIYTYFLIFFKNFFEIFF